MSAPETAAPAAATAARLPLPAGAGPEAAQAGDTPPLTVGSLRAADQKNAGATEAVAATTSLYGAAPGTPATPPLTARLAGSAPAAPLPPPRSTSLSKLSTPKVPSPPLPSGTPSSSNAPVDLALQSSCKSLHHRDSLPTSGSPSSSSSFPPKTSSDSSPPLETSDSMLHHSAKPSLASLVRQPQSVAAGGFTASNGLPPPSLPSSTGPAVAPAPPPKRQNEGLQRLRTSPNIPRPDLRPGSHEASFSDVVDAGAGFDTVIRPRIDDPATGGDAFLPSPLSSVPADSGQFPRRRLSTASSAVSDDTVESRHQVGGNAQEARPTAGAGAGYLLPSPGEAEEHTATQVTGSPLLQPNADSSQGSLAVAGADRRRSRVLVDEFGFLLLDESPDAETIPAETARDQEALQAYRDRESKWLAVMSGMDAKTAKKKPKAKSLIPFNQIKKLVRQGIPESLRGKVWMYLSGADTLRKPNEYEELLKRPRIPIYDIIERDINRCYPDHVMFRADGSIGQTELYNILKAYAHYNPEVGYCQGMGRLVGMMLMQLPAEDTFWLLVATLAGPMLGYFSPSLSQLRIDSVVFERLLAAHSPKLAQHFADEDIIPLMYMTNWFMTVFTMALPWASVLRVWDMFYYEGAKVFFRTGLAILDCCQSYLLQSCPTNSEILSYLLHIPQSTLAPEKLLAAAAKVRLRTAEIERLKAAAAKAGVPDRGAPKQLSGAKKKKLTKPRPPGSQAKQKAENSK